MNVNIIGGGPAGLYLSILMKKSYPDDHIRVFERNRSHDTFGWGVVFSDQTLDTLRRADAPTHGEIVAAFAHWDDIDIHFKGRVMSSGGHGFSGIARRKLLNILQDRASVLGAELHFECEVTELAPYADADLIIAADGINSRIRALRAEQFEPELERRNCKYVWLGTHKRFDAFTFIFENTPWGWFTVHAYRFDRDTSTFIVECREETWQAAGLSEADTPQTIAFCERLFSGYLDGHSLLANSAHLRGSDWLNFVRVTNKHWTDGNIVLMGDAAHSAHFSVGSGTKLAMEDAIGLHDAVRKHTALADALEAYETSRRVEVLRLQNAARNSTEWFENVARYAVLPPEQFAYSLLTRSQRISHENLRLRDKGYVERIETWLAEKAADGYQPTAVPPMFTPFRLRELQLRNRVVVSPMDMYSAVDGIPNDFHLVHLGTRAIGGAALVYTEMTCVSPEGRITYGCTGMYLRNHVAAWKRIVEFVHEFTQAKICMQLGHSGPKGSTRLMWEGMDEPLIAGNWEVVGPSAIPYGPENQTPRELRRDEMDVIREQFVHATQMAEEAGFDMLELHCAHGYLLSSFITPLQNRRTDEYGGSLENRLRYPLEVFTAMRAAWPVHKPMSVRISATDWVEGGIAGEESVEIARAFKDAGVDLIDVSTGQTSRQAKPVYGRMWQTPYSDRIRNEVGVATMAVGNIFEPDHVNSIIAAGRADLCALARPHLADPYWTLHAATQLGYTGMEWPNQYLTGKSQYERNLARTAEAAQTI
ncbi:MAG: bifunctional salicylyl-CoA 5-hydroxylase/oxidoreductase [Candidatus Eremiobacteraeota bacterium]|nr:bifunctional salicylyl-CoA 5-hydroxylase/oxidoreductase [Candidatus Eremiobacteraeota bacterium]